jgi:hypothetical protein
MSFSRWVFRIAGIYGLLAIAPMFFLEDRIGRDMPPPINHPEYFYGFAGVTLAWQIAFLVISLDPLRYRLLMIPAIVEKFSFVIAAVALLLQDRMPLPIFGGAMLDLVLGVLFVASFVATPPGTASSS